jgi:glycine/D-amino acid oxidase-like deaminating enzyme
MQGIAAKAESEGVTITGNVEVTGVEFSGKAISAVITNR